MKKRLLSLFLCFVIVLTLLPSTLAAEPGVYDPQAALKFAAEHWNDGIGLCAEFVSRCLRAGGCDSYNKSCTKLVGMLRNRTDCKEFKIMLNPDKSIPMKDHLDKVSPGDPLFFHCSNQNNYQHAILCNGMDENGLMKVYAHNAASDGTRAIRYSQYCPECAHMSIDYVTGFHFEQKPPKLNVLMSESKNGGAADTFVAGNQYYLHYSLLSPDTAQPYDSYGREPYKIAMEVYAPDDSILCSYSFRNDRNCLSVRFPTAGTYRYSVILNGKITDSVTGSIEVKEGRVSLSAHSTSETLCLSEEHEKTVRLQVQGFHSAPLSLKMTQTANEICDASLSSFDGRTAELTLKPRSIGQGNVAVSLIDTQSEKELAATEIAVNVIGTEAAVSYFDYPDAPAVQLQSAYCGETVLLDGKVPQRTPYKVQFDPNGGVMENTERQYTPRFTSWNTKPDGSGTSYLSGEQCVMSGDISLYAQYDRCVLEENAIPTKDGFRFVGWFDAPTLDENGKPTGTYYGAGSALLKDLTLYAIWSSAPTLLFGDLNDDGVLNAADRTILKACVENDENDSKSAFLGDLNVDGTIDSEDLFLMDELLCGQIEAQLLPAVCAQKTASAGGSMKTEYAYGEALDCTGLALTIACDTQASYSISDYLTVTGYDPFRIGTQSLTVSFGQWSAAFSVTVAAPSYLLNFDANGGVLHANQMRVRNGETIGTLPTPIKQGYTFLGWSFAPSATEYLTEETVYTEFSDATVYANWKNGCSEDSHAYEATLTAPTCTQAGSERQVCSICAKTCNKETAALLEHSFDEGFCVHCGQKDRAFVHGICSGKNDCLGAAFADMPHPTDWAHDGIDYCLKNALFVGLSETEFAPQLAMTRAMLVAVLYRMEGSPAHTGQQPFADVDGDAWYADAVLWAAENKIVNGMEPDQFAPNLNITREQIATIFYRYAAYRHLDLSVSGSLESYPDKNNVSTWAYDALCWANEIGLIRGVGRQGTGYLDPKAHTTRAQVAAIIMRFNRQFR